MQILAHASKKLLRAASAAARRAAEDKAAVQAEVAVLRHDLGSTLQELDRLREIEGTCLGCACNCNAVEIAKIASKHQIPI